MSHDTEEEALREALSGLEMPAEGLRRWFQQSRAFCEGHGGRRVYGELLALLDECESLLSEGARGGER